MWADLTESLNFAGPSLQVEAHLLPFTEVNYALHEESVMTSP